MKRPRLPSKIAEFKRTIRKVAHAQLDELLDEQLNDLAARMALGAAMRVNVQVMQPEAGGRVAEDVTVTEREEAPKPLVEVVSK